MKNTITTLLLLTAFFSQAQVGIGVAPENIEPSAQLEVKSTNKGFLPPRMLAAERDLISSPVAGLLIYQTDAPAGLYYYTGSTWDIVNTGSGGGVSSIGTFGTATPNGASIANGELNLAPADENYGGIVTTGNQNFGGDKTFNSNLTVNGFSDIRDAMFTGQRFDVMSDAKFFGQRFDVMSDAMFGRNIFNGGNITSNSFIKQNGLSTEYLMADGSTSTSTGGIATLGAISPTSTANGASITAGELNLAPADETNGGIVTTGSQTFAGEKIFNNKVSVGGTSSIASAVLEVKSTTQGFLPPRMTAAQRNSITDPALGLVVYCTDCGTYGELEVFNGSNTWTNAVGGPKADPTYVYHYGYIGNGSGTYTFNGTEWSPVTTNTPSNFYGDGYIGQIATKSYYKIYDDVSQAEKIFSFDGTTWSALSTTFPEGIYGSYTYIGAINNKVFHKTITAINNDWNNPITTLYSFDGTTWSTISTNSIPEGIEGSYTYIGAINNKVYHKTTTAINNDWNNPITTLYSFDGTIWSTISTNSTPEGIDRNFSYVGVLNNKVYHKTTTAINNDWNNPITTLYSFDGTIWSIISTNATPDGIGYNSYIGVLHNKIFHNAYTWDNTTQTTIYTMYSFDGTTWNTEAVIKPTENGQFGGWLGDMMMMRSSLILH
jgi:hypothetical protein